MSRLDAIAAYGEEEMQPEPITIRTTMEFGKAEHRLDGGWPKLTMIAVDFSASFIARSDGVAAIVIGKDWAIYRRIDPIEFPNPRYVLHADGTVDAPKTPEVTHAQ